MYNCKVMLCYRAPESTSAEGTSFVRSLNTVSINVKEDACVLELDGVNVTVKYHVIRIKYTRM